MTFHKSPTVRHKSRLCITSIAVFAAMFFLGFSSTAGRALAKQNGTYVPNAVNRMPDANDRDKMQQQQSDQQRVEAANAERKKQICADSDKLLKMAADLKDELDKTSQDTLSLETIRKIDAIQKLAKDMKDKLRLRSN